MESSGFSAIVAAAWYLVHGYTEREARDRLNDRFPQLGEAGIDHAIQGARKSRREGENALRQQSANSTLNEIDGSSESDYDLLMKIRIRTDDNPENDIWASRRVSFPGSVTGAEISAFFEKWLEELRNDQRPVKSPPVPAEGQATFGIEWIIPKSR